MAVHAVTKNPRARGRGAGILNGILARADKIDKQALLEEKLGHALPISYEDWLKDCHYESWTQS